LDPHLKQQQESIGEALSELMTPEDDHTQAYRAIIDAVEEWVVYHEKEARKWRMLRVSLGPTRV
jgi:hypothetical protein